MVKWWITITIQQYSPASGEQFISDSMVVFFFFFPPMDQSYSLEAYQFLEDNTCNKTQFAVLICCVFPPSAPHSAQLEEGWSSTNKTLVELPNSKDLQGRI